LINIHCPTNFGVSGVARLLSEKLCVVDVKMV